MQYKCETCKDKKHVAVDGAYATCPNCFRLTQAAARLEKIPPHLRNFGLDDIPKCDAAEVLKKVLQRLSSRQYPKKFVVLVGAKPKDTLLAAFIRDISLAGKSIERTSFQKVTDTYFNEKEEWRRLLEVDPDVLILQIGSEILNSASTPVLRDVVQERMWSGLYTILTLDSKLQDLKRNPKVPTDFLDLLGSDVFSEVLY